MKEREIGKLKDIEKNFNEKVSAIERSKDFEIKKYKSSYEKEQDMKKDVMDRLENLRSELKMLEKNEGGGGMADVWK